MLFLTGFLAGIIVRVIGVKRSGYHREERTNLPAGESMLLFLVFLGMQILPLIYLFTSWLGFADYFLPGWLSQLTGWTGAGFFVMALWLLWRSHADLGRSFSPGLEIREGQVLVTEGVFRHIRHPMYTAHMLWAIAQLLLLQNWIAGPAMLLAQIPFYLYRIPREEGLLLTEFGAEYRRYMHRTGRLLPRFRPGPQKST